MSPNRSKRHFKIMPKPNFTSLITQSLSLNEDFLPSSHYKYKNKPKESISSKRDKLKLSGHFKKKPAESFKEAPVLSRLINQQSTLGSWDQLNLIQ